MILSLRVFGSSGVKTIFAGFAIGPIFLPVRSSLRPQTAASATFLWSTSALSTSIVEIRWPEMFITSSTRPSSQ
jgi:hypothetical protein